MLGASENLPDHAQLIHSHNLISDMMQQVTFLSLGCLTKRTRADAFLDEMNWVVPWAELRVHSNCIVPPARCRRSAASAA